MERKPNASRRYQLTIAGGGVSGAALAWEAAHRGLSVLLLEKDDFANATSANSLKTIHGGLRALQSLNLFSCVESASERKAWLRMMPELVRPMPCLLPTTKKLAKHRVLVWAGLFLYNLLTAGRNSGMSQSTHIPPGQLLRRASLFERVPLLKDDNYTGGALWYDAQVTNTERAVLAFLRAAETVGAKTINYATIDNIEPKGKVSRVCCTDQITGDQFEVSTECFVDCTGSGRLLDRQFNNDHQISYLKAVNIVIPKRCVSTAIGTKALDESGMSRLLFLSPWHECTLIGTWYFENHDDIAKISESQLAECIRQVNSLFSTPQIKTDDVSLIHVGFLPADKAAIVSRGTDGALLKGGRIVDWEKLNREQHGLYSLRCTKFTLARRDAKTLVDKIAGKQSMVVGTSRSHHAALWTKPTPRELDNFKLNANLDPEQLEFLCKRLPDILACMINQYDLQDDNLPRGEVPGSTYCPVIAIDFCVRHERCHHLDDLLLRRLPIGNAIRPPIETVDYCLKFMSEVFSWSRERQALELERLNNNYVKTYSTNQLNSTRSGSK